MKQSSQNGLLVVKSMGTYEFISKQSWAYALGMATRISERNAIYAVLIVALLSRVQDLHMPTETPVAESPEESKTLIWFISQHWI